MVPAQGAKLEIDQLVVCFLVCVHAGEAFIKRDMPYKADCVTRRMEAGLALRERGVKDEGMAPYKKHPHRKGSAGRGTGD